MAHKGKLTVSTVAWHTFVLFSELAVFLSCSCFGKFVFSIFSAFYFHICLLGLSVFASASFLCCSILLLHLFNVSCVFFRLLHHFWVCTVWPFASPCRPLYSTHNIVLFFFVLVFFKIKFSTQHSEQEMISFLTQCLP